MSKTQPRKTAETPTTPIPPLVAAIFTFVDPGYRTITPEFQRAWAAAPDLVQQFTNSHDSGEPRYAFVTKEVEAAIAQSRKAKEPYGRRLAEAVDALDEINDGYLHQLYQAHTEPAFAIGLALGLYLVTNGGGVR